MGSGVRMGSIHKAAKNFIGSHGSELGSKKLGLFITNSFSDSVDEIITAAFPEELRRNAVWVGSVGGRLDIENLSGIDKFIAKAVSKAVNEGRKVNDKLDDTALDQLIACFE